MKKLILGLVLIVVLVGAVACGKSEEQSPQSGITGPRTTYATQVPAPTIITKGGFDTGAPPPVVSIPSSAPQAGSGSVAYDSVSIDRMIIRSGYMTLVVEDVAASIDDITRLAGTYNGFVVSSNSWKDGDRMMGNITIRVEVQRFDEAIAALHALAVEVRSESTSGQDVTEEYVDLAARLRNLEAAEAQLLKLMEEKTEKVTDILEVQRELVKTRGEIEQTKGRMQFLEQSASMSSLQVNLEQSKLSAEFSADTRNVKEGQDVRFFPKISGGFSPYSYSWNFGDGGTSTEESPVHAYKTDGNYTVTLKVTDDRGNPAEDVRTDYITVLPGWSGSNVADAAWDGLVAFFRVIVNIIIWVGIFSPLWIVILVILYFTWWRKRKKA
ncbi:MAG: hypothetical protein A2Z29_03350 [Chloroflexi bacterium RBG_16_56_11]|nr:MAG: hypothetical protein A2Z29_03350 [Chloroflexi bacterium RBG_16_56_11]